MIEQKQRTVSTWPMPMCMIFTRTLIQQGGNGRRPLRALRAKR
jgi:hypothetical protein